MDTLFTEYTYKKNIYLFPFRIATIIHCINLVYSSRVKRERRGGKGREREVLRREGRVCIKSNVRGGWEGVGGVGLVHLFHLNKVKMSQTKVYKFQIDL